MSQQRYIKSYPSYMDSPIWRDDGVFKLYHYCLYKSSHNTYMWHGQQINPGELPISIRGASSELGWSVNKLQQKLDALQKSGFISVFACSYGTLIRILGWFNHQESVPCIDNSIAPVSENDTHINYRYIPVLKTDMPSIDNRYGSVSETDNNQYMKDNNCFFTSTSETEGFQKLWLSYPSARRTHRDEAAEEYTKALADGATLESIMDALEADKQSADWSKDSGRYIPGIAKWLQKEKWRESIPSKESGGNTKWTSR